MSALGPKKKILLYILIGIVAAAVVISLVLDIITNNGGRVVLVGAIAGIVVAAAVFLVFNLISKKNSEANAFEEEGEESRFTRTRNKKNKNDVFEAAGFEDDFSQQDYNGFDDFDDRMDDEMIIEQQVDQNEVKNRFDMPPSQQLREKGFFGRKTAEEETDNIESFESEEDEDIVWNEPEYDDSFDTESESLYENEFEDSGFEDEDFGKPVIAFGDPAPTEENNASEEYEQEHYSEYSEEPAEVEEAFETDAEYNEPQYEENEHEEPQSEETYSEPEIEEEPAEPQPEPQNSLLLKDIAPGMVVASQSPGQTLESFYADMSEEDIIYRDCVEVWSSAAKNPMMKILEKLKNIDDKKVAGELGRDCEYVNAMIDRMLYFTQLEMIDQALNMQVYNYSVLVKECLKRFSPFFTEKKISLLWKGLDVNVITDKRWFIFAMTQVIFNSIEFTPHGGKIAVSAKKADDYVDLIIDDSGEGMDEEELPYAFTAGFMGDEAPNPDDTRTGMGLFITRSVLQKLGGECMAESSKGKGMRIVIRLPAMKEEAES